MTNTTTATNTPDDPKAESSTQAILIQWRQRLPEWVKQLPRLRDTPKANQSFQLLNTVEKDAILAQMDAAAKKRIAEDIEHLESELLVYFRQHDADAAYQQNRYRMYQIGYIGLATLATIVGSIQALFLTSDVNIVRIAAFIEVMISLFAVYLANLGAQEPPLPAWMDNRRRAEALRREYFRYLVNLPPYDALTGFERRGQLSRRAALLNRGSNPDDINPNPSSSDEAKVQP